MDKIHTSWRRDSALRGCRRKPHTDVADCTARPLQHRKHGRGQPFTDTAPAFSSKPISRDNLWGCYGGRRQRLVRDDQRLEEHVQGVVKELVNAETVDVF